MKIETNMEYILDLMDRPAFCVDGGVIKAANRSALARTVSIGTPVAPLISIGLEEYRNFTSGCLYLTLSIGGHSSGATVTRLGDMDVFTLDGDDAAAELRAYALAAQQLRKPLSQALSISDQFFPELAEHKDPQVNRQLARMNRSLHQMLRLVGNMSDARTAGFAQMEILELTSVVQEIMDHAANLAQSTGVEISFVNHPRPVYSLADSQKLERAIYNLLSNAMKYSAPGGKIEASLKCRGMILYFTVTNAGDSSGSSLSAGMFNRFLREPGIEDSRSGLGLGYALVRSIAAAHHGTLLVDQSGGSTRATLSLPIRQESGILRSPTVSIDYAGERDHGLIELSEHLPPALYGFSEE